jgi:endo-1,4-beta-mannosidase
LKRRWAAWPVFIALCLPAILSGEASANRLPRVSLDGQYFSAEGRRFLPVGAHWIPAKSAVLWPLYWEPKQVEADFVRMKELGFNTVRLDLLWAWFEPRPGDYNPEAFQQLDYLLTLAHRYGIYLHPTLFVGGEVGEAYWDVPWRRGRHPHSDPEMLFFETNHAAELARRYKDETAILAWDLTDEPPFWVVQGTTSDAMAANWTRLIAGALRRFDPNHPIVAGTSMEDVGHGPFRPDNIRSEVDFFSVHPYTIYAPNLFPDSLLSKRASLGAAFETALSGSLGRPVMVQELGISSAQYDPALAAAYDRMSLYSSLGAGANGFLLWCFSDADPQQYRAVPYLRSPHETQFGLIDAEGHDRPRAKSFREFALVTSQLDLNGMTPDPPLTGIVVPQEWSKAAGDFSKLGLKGPEAIPYTSIHDGNTSQQPAGTSADNLVLTQAWLASYVLARQAGLSVAFPREQEDWQQRAAVLLPAPLTSTEAALIHVHTDFWEKALRYVEKGGALYASFSGDAAIPGMSRLFGASLLDRQPVSEVTLRVVKLFGGLKPGDTFHYSANGDSPRYWKAVLGVDGGTVIAVDQDNQPALIAHQVGRGHTLISAYPIESYLGRQPSAFDGADETHRIYAALAAWAGIHADFETGNISVEIATLRAQGRGYAVLVNHSSQAQSVTVSSRLALKSVARVTPKGPIAIALQDNHWTVGLQPWEGAIVDWKMKP